MADPSTAWLRRPQLRTLASEEDRRASAYELFFDLVFVAAVSQLAAALSRDPTVSGFLRFAGLYVAISWAWGGFTFYGNRFEDDDLAHRLLLALAMLAIAALATSVHSVMSGGHRSSLFAISYVVIRICLLALYARAWLYASEAGRALTGRYLLGFSTGVCLWLASLAVSGPARYWLWAAALAVELTTPLLAWRTLRGVASVNVAHITERYGGFFIIVLGESVVAVVASVAGTQLSARASVIAVAGFVTALCVWWIYFDLADTSVVGRGMLGLVYVYAHVPLTAGVAVSAAGIKLAIVHADAPGLEAGARWALAGGVACFLLSLALLHVAAEWTTLRDRAFLGRLASSAAVLALAAVGGAIAPVAFVAALAAILIAQLVLELLTQPFGAASVVTPDASLPDASARLHA